MKRILGLDLGTNSIGWALVNGHENDDTIEGIVAANSRIIPMDATQLGDFAKGNTKSATSERTTFRSARKVHQRHILRRERLHRVLDLMGFLPEHYAKSLTRYGKFKDNCECKLPWRHNEDGTWSFIFMDSYNEMLREFRSAQPDWLANGGKVPYDWTIYYLRKKALHAPITKEELSWILLNFNAKRGYYQLRSEDTEQDDASQRVEYCALKVVSVEDTGQKKGKDTWFNIHLENGMVYARTASTAPEWVGMVKDFIITTKLDKNGKPKRDKNGEIDQKLRMPKADDWTLVMKKTEADLDKSHKSIGEFIYDALLKNPEQKIKGGLVRHVERKYYKNELTAILNEQKQYLPELQDRALYQQCITELYGSNDAYRQSIEGHDFTYLLANDIILYQRPLKSKKSLISNCQYERHTYIDAETGLRKAAPVKCIAKSNPLFQEFRLWQFVQNLKIYERSKVVNGRMRVDVDVTDTMLPSEADRVRLFDYLNDRKEIKQDSLLKTYFKVKAARGAELPFRWNYVEDKTYPCNETRAQLLAGLKKAHLSDSFLNAETERKLWHILYSVEDKQELATAIHKFATKNGLNSDFEAVFSKMPPFKKDYGSYSEKAIKKLLPLMRMGKYWDYNAIDQNTANRIDKLINGEYDDQINDRVREKTSQLTSASMFRGLPLWLACYVVYGRHSEAAEAHQWHSPADIDAWLAQFRQHSLCNPIVEQIVTETMRTVRDIWATYGRIDEIHIEMARDLKNTAEKRRQMTERIAQNENTNLR